MWMIAVIIIVLALLARWAYKKLQRAQGELELRLTNLDAQIREVEAAPREAATRIEREINVLLHSAATTAVETHNLRGDVSALLETIRGLRQNDSSSEDERLLVITTDIPGLREEILRKRVTESSSHKKQENLVRMRDHHPTMSTANIGQVLQLLEEHYPMEKINVEVQQEAPEFAKPIWIPNERGGLNFPMGQSIDVLGTCDGAKGTDGEPGPKRNQPRQAGSGWDEDVVVVCAALEEGVTSMVATANRGGARISDEVLLNHELLQYARQGNLRGLSEALDKGAWTETRRPLVMKPQKPEPGKKVDDPPTVGMTPIMSESQFSAQKGSADCVRRLIQARAEINAVEEDGWSALHFASKEGHLQACQTLIQAKADVGLKNADEKAPLDVADEDGSFKVSLTELVKERLAEELAAPPLAPNKAVMSFVNPFELRRILLPIAMIPETFEGPAFVHSCCAVALS
eukprot:s592_g7.t1